MKGSRVVTGSVLNKKTRESVRKNEGVLPRVVSVICL